jgi:hypothetical protein
MATIRFAGALPNASILDLTNHAGAIDLFVPVKQQVQFTLSQYSGEFTDEFGFARNTAGLGRKHRISLRDGEAAREGDTTVVQRKDFDTAAAVGATAAERDRIRRGRHRLASNAGFEGS